MPDFSLVQFQEGTPHWPVQTRGQAGYSDPQDPASLVSEVGVNEVQAALPAIGGGMRPKLAACVDAIHGGVSSAAIVDGRVPHSLLMELFTDAGQGTKIGPGGGP